MPDTHLPQSCQLQRKSQSLQLLCSLQDSVGEPEPEVELCFVHFMMTDCVRGLKPYSTAAGAEARGGVIGGVGNRRYCICGNCCSGSQLPGPFCAMYGGVLYGV